MTNISINKLHEFRDHPYQVLDNEEMNSLIESVQQQGIMMPLIVRPLEGTTDEYEIISGHRRFRAAQKAGLAEVPAFIRPVSRDEAAIMVVDSNLHREHLLPSEKAFAYKLKAEALKTTVILLIKPSSFYRLSRSIKTFCRCGVRPHSRRPLPLLIFPLPIFRYT